MIRRWITAGLGLAPTAALAAACCGGGASFPSLILSDAQAQLGLSLSLSRVVGDAPTQGRPVFRSDRDSEWIHIYTLDASHLISDRWQMGVALPMARRSRSTSSAEAARFGFGDISGTIGFEFLPEFTFSNWKPRGFLFSQIIVPTGGNIYEATAPFSVDARGKGLFTLSIGAFLLKTLGAWDASVRLALAHSLAKTFAATDGSTISLTSGIDVQAAVSLGYSPREGPWRWGISIQPSLTAASSVQERKRVWMTTFDVSRMIADSWSLGLSYNDQTLLGPAQNTSLERGLSGYIRYRWDR